METCFHNEDTCYFVSTVGLSLLADQKPTYSLHKHNNQLTRNVIYNFNFNNKKGEIVYIKSTHLLDFFTYTLHRFDNPIFIISNGDDNIYPYDFDFKIDVTHPKLAGLFIQNNFETNLKFKVFHIPIGIDYHTLNWERGQHLWGKTCSSASDQEKVLNECIAQMSHIKSCRWDKVITNFHLAMKDPPRRHSLRQPIYDAIKDKSWIVWLPEMSREEFWLSCKDHAFVLCPPGNGPDTHRTWEVLMLGRIPIVDAIPLNKVFEGLPVWAIQGLKNLAHISEADLKKKFFEFVDKWDTYDWSKLSLNYWKTYITAITDNFKSS
jgi:hypothetical protein